MKRDDISASGDDPINGTQRPTGKKHFRSLSAPAHLVVLVYPFIPADGVFEPLFLRKAQHLFNLWADVRLATTPIQRNHENDSRELLNQCPIFCVQVWEASSGEICRVSACTVVLPEDPGDAEQRGFGVLRVQAQQHWLLSLFGSRHPNDASRRAPC